MPTGVLPFTFSTLTTLLLVVDAPAAVPLFLSMTVVEGIATLLPTIVASVAGSAR